MSFLNIGSALENRQSFHCVKEGEYKVNISGAFIVKDGKYLSVRFEVQDDPYAKEISDIFTLPGHADTEREEAQNLERLANFFDAFQIDPAGNYEVDRDYPEGFCGREGWIMAGPPIDNGKGFGEQNRVKKYMVGH